MTHHGWVPVLDRTTLTPNGLKSPFGRLFPAADHSYDSFAISLLSGAFGPLQEANNDAGAPPAPALKPSNHTGFTFLGQFIDHDLTEFRVIGPEYSLIPQNPTIGQRQRVLTDIRDPVEPLPTTTNGRTGKLDLDSVYGLLGGAQPDLFTQLGQFVFAEKTSPGDGDDIARGDKYRNRRLIADPRNDENKLVLQIHMLFQKLHNTIHEPKPGSEPEKGPTGPAFLATKASVLRVFHRIVMHDYLPRIVQAEHIDAVLSKMEHHKTAYQAMNVLNNGALAELGVAPAPAMPVEFSHAAFRLGHSQLRNGYVIRRISDTAVFGSPLFNTNRNQFDLRGDDHLIQGTGNDRLDFHVDWNYFFKLSDKPAGTAPDEPQPGEAIDGTLPASLFRLPPPTIGEPPISLAERNIRRGIDFGLPSGQQVAGHLSEIYGYIRPTGLDELFSTAVFDRFKEVLSREPKLQWDTPLWYYIIREAEQYKDGPQLGPVGGYIVAETLIGALVESMQCMKDKDGAPIYGCADVAIAHLIHERSELAKEFTAAGKEWWEEIDTGRRAWQTKPKNPEEIWSMSQLVHYIGGKES